MQQGIERMIGFKVRATDGVLGKICDFFFDDETWTIRYMVAEAGSWLSSRKVLISLASLGEPDWKARTFSVNLTREQVRNSPDIDTEMPVSRLHEEELHRHYDLPYYWPGAYSGSYMGAFGVGYFPVVVEEDASSARPHHQNPHLRSARDIAGFDIFGSDGRIGKVEDLIVGGSWNIRYIVVKAPGRTAERLALISPQWIRKADWDAGKFTVDVTRDGFKNAPAFDPSKPVSPEYENMLLGHLQKPDPCEWVSFRFHAAPGAEVFIAGTFNDWKLPGVRLHHVKNDLYAATLLLKQGRYEYRFLVNGHWCNGDCKDQVPNPFGSMNNVVVVSPQMHKGHAHTFSRFSKSADRRTLWSSVMDG